MRLLGSVVTREGIVLDGSVLMPVNTVPAPKILCQPLFLQDEWRLIYEALSIAKIQWQVMEVQASDREIVKIMRKKADCAYVLQQKIEGFI